MIKTEIQEEYFEWMYIIACNGNKREENVYSDLLSYLHSIIFTYSIKDDANRAEDGRDLRLRFIDEYGIEDADFLMNEPCSVLEMILGLAVRIEETIMDDPSIGNRTSQWFWNMLVTMGLGGMRNDRFDKDIAEKAIMRFLERKYEPNGEGGLFRVSNTNQDLRKIKIWTQALWYLDSIS